MIVGEIIKNLQEQKGYSQKELAKLLHITPGCLSKYETGRIQPPIEMLIQIADALNVSVDYLIGRNNVEMDYRQIKDRYYKDISCLRLLQDALSLEQHSRKALLDILDALKVRDEMHRITGS